MQDIMTVRFGQRSGPRAARPDFPRLFHENQELNNDLIPDDGVTEIIVVNTLDRLDGAGE